MYHQTQKFITNSQNAKIVTEINSLLEGCDEFVISVAFITLSGVMCILEALHQLNLKGIKGSILTGCYLNFTEPKALDKLLEFENIELKVLTNENFHAKGFFFRKDDNWAMMIGSSNLTQSALTINNEWNIFFQTNANQEIYQQIIAEFNRLFVKATDCRNIIEEYRLNYQSIKNTTSLELYRQAQTILPNTIQRQALENLNVLRNDGKDKALIISATGTGKTFLSAFDVIRVNPKRCLFIVHRTNIAAKASETFSKVIKGKSIGLYTGSNKSSADYLFATIQTLKNPEVLAKFEHDEFDYIIIDEVHHADAQSYKRVLKHFKPKFLLGMTATPERTDDADIFKLFDYNIAYEIRLHQALEEDLLCPFHYFAIEDFYLETEKSLAKDFSKLISDERVEHIVDKMHFYGFSGDKRSALLFVSNVNEAIDIAIKLNQKGIKAQSLTSQDPEHIRELAIQELEAKRLEVIVTVDIFNEGVDIPCLNQIILLRPTQSAIVYIQQLGRGLRKHRDKKFVTILDFIANYENNFLIPVALSGNNSYDKDELKKFVVAPNNFISGKSTITFTGVAKELIYRNIQKTNFSQLKNIKKDYVQLKKELGRIPRLVDFERHNFIAPEVILKAKDTYYDILQVFKEPINTLNNDEYQILKFISKEFTPAKRLYETLILKKLIDTPFISIDDLRMLLEDNIADFSQQSFANALHHLSLQIFTVNAGRTEYKPLIEINNYNVTFLAYKTIEQNKLLSIQTKDLLEYNKIIYAKKYYQNKIQGLALYQKYSKKDIAHLLNQDYTNGGVNLAGYRVFDDKALLFMTFDESKKFTQFDNRFISDNSFTYFSKKNKSTTNTVEKGLIENQYTSFVFARVDKSDDYCFLGLIGECMEATELYEPIKMIRFTFKLQQNIPKELWQYFKNIYKNKK
ncbi:MAG: superfamily II DNA or RNA helicase [Francisella sp.]|jgi:superfamily II DNA or RNA helicase